jgi:hypothetical protein
MQLVGERAAKTLVEQQTQQRDTYRSEHPERHSGDQRHSPVQKPAALTDDILATVDATDPG